MSICMPTLGKTMGQFIFPDSLKTDQGKITRIQSPLYTIKFQNQNGQPVPDAKCQVEVDVIVIKVELGIDVDDDGDIDSIDDAEEENTGAIVFENWDNDDDDSDFKPDNTENTVSGEDDLVRIELNIEPASLNVGTVKLESSSSKLKIWKSATKENMPVSLGTAWDLSTTSIPSELFVEGFDESDSKNDIQLTLSYIALGGNTPICEDKINVTVVRLNLGVAVYRELDFGQEWKDWLVGFCPAPEYDHTGVIHKYIGPRTRAGLLEDNNWDVIEMQAGPNTILTTTLLLFKSPSPSSTLAYFGAHTNKTEFENDTKRNELIDKIETLRFSVFPEYTTSTLDPVPRAIKFNDINGNSVPDLISEVTALRCDGLPEYVYEHTGIPVWFNAVTGKIDITFFPEDHNDRPECTLNPDSELSPRAQYGGFGNANTSFQLIQIFELGISP